MKRLIPLLFLLAAFLPSPAHAICNATLPFVLQPGTLADATQVMANFNAIISGLNNTCAASGINNDITALNGVAVLKPQNNLSDVLNKQTSVNNLGLGCSNASPFNNTTAGAVNGVYATCFGVKADGVTNDTTAWNAAVAWLNGGASRQVIAPPGNSLITVLNPFTTGGRIVCITGTGSCTITHSGNNAFEWKNTAVGGGMQGMTLNNSGSTANATVFIHGNAFYSRFDDIILGPGIGIFATMGTTTTNDQAGTAFFNRIYSPSGVGGGASPLFNMVNGFGFEMSQSGLWTSAAGSAGRYFMLASIVGPLINGNGVYDTISIKDSVIGPWNEFFHAALTLGGSVLDSNFSNNYIINCQVFCFNVTGTGQFTASSITNNWIDGNGTATACVNLSPTNLFGMIFTGNRVLTCSGSGVLLNGGFGTNTLTVTNNLIGDINLCACGTTYGLLVVGDALSNLMNDILIQGNLITNQFIGGNLPTFGISVGSTTVGVLQPTGFRLLNNDATGSTLNYAWPTTLGKDSLVYANAHLLPATGALVIGASPFTYTNGTGQQQDVWIYDGTYNPVTVNGCCFVGSLAVPPANDFRPLFIHLNPGESFTITWTVQPHATVNTY